MPIYKKRKKSLSSRWKMLRKKRKRMKRNRKRKNKLTAPKRISKKQKKT